MLVTGTGKWTHNQRGEAEFTLQAIGDDELECKHLQSLVDTDLFMVEASFSGGALKLTVTATQPPVAVQAPTPLLESEVPPTAPVLPPEATVEANPS
jgi:hypothetical protein